MGAQVAKKTRTTLCFVGLLAAMAVIGTAPNALAGPKSYNINVLLDEPHPFAAAPNTSAPAYIPADQIRPRARVPQPFPYRQPTVRTAAERSARDRVPAATAQSLSLPSTPRKKGLWGFISEIRIGALAHDIGPFSSNEEDVIVDYNGELLFNSPGFLDLIWAPRPHVGFTLNTGGDTSQVYAGLTWEFDVWRSWFINFSLGGSLHDGELRTTAINRKELGCHLLFRESFEVGYRFESGHSITGFLDHISNANICDANEGLETAGIRYGYRF